MPRDVNSRIVRIEEYLKPAACPVCLGRPSRVVTIDSMTDQEMSANMPAEGCLACGTAVFREYVLVVEDTDAGGKAG